MRITKNPEERKNEILDMAEILFVSKGYGSTTIQDILEGVAIAKGTFYYYFKSKEEVLDAMIMRFIDATVVAAQEIAASPGLSATEKLFQIFFVLDPRKAIKQAEHRGQMIEQFQAQLNPEMNQKTMVLTVQKLSPVLTQVLQQGMEEGLFACQYPRETVELLLITSSVLFNDKIFAFSAEELQPRVKAFIKSMEVLLGAQTGSFDFIINMLM